MRVARREFLRVLALGAIAVPAAARAAVARGPELVGLRVRSLRPFAGDRRLLATVSPRRREARVSFRLPRPATVRMEAVRTDTIREGRPAGETVWSVERRLPAGSHELGWRPGRGVAPRTYVLRLTAVDAAGRRRVYGAYRPGRRPDAPVVRVQGVEVATTRSSYLPGQPADLLISTDAATLRVQVFHYGESRPADADLRTNGIPVTPPVVVDWRAHADAPGRLRLLRAGAWQSGLYFVGVGADDGRAGYAPFILRPRRLGTQRVAVVLSTNTWQAYNFHDADGDGWGDSWYVSDALHAVDVGRPYLDFGVPFRFKDWDLAFVSWLNRTGKRVDFLSDEDLEAAGSGDALRRAYDLVVFPGHAEYVTARAYDVVERYRDLGGNLLFLAANNFFWRVRRDGRRIVRERRWRDAGRDEAGLVGVHYVGSDQGQRQAAFTVVGAGSAPWLFEGTGLRDGDTFGRYGIEIDGRGPATPRSAQVLAHATDLMGAGRSAELTYYETPAGARVLAAGAINFVASMTDPRVERLVENAWRRLSAP
ncbi:MAG: N,N-dimethylformamidase beta subunit family domain-containing protein [Pseudomonadota bacterium]